MTDLTARERANAHWETLSVDEQTAYKILTVTLASHPAATRERLERQFMLDWLARRKDGQPPARDA